MKMDWFGGWPWWRWPCLPPQRLDRQRQRGKSAPMTSPLPVEDPSRGILGPIIHAEVGDTIDVAYQNHTTVPTSVHPQGGFHDKGSEGSMTLDGTSAEQMADDHVPPGGSHT